MIGGATTSKIHTAVKIAPNYSAPVIHVRDASKGVNVSASLISEEMTKDYAVGVKAKYQNMKDEHDAKKKTSTYITYQEAIKNKLNIEWSENHIEKPIFGQTFYIIIRWKKSGNISIGLSFSMHGNSMENIPQFLTTR